MAEAHRTCMRMRENHGGPIYLYKHICTWRAAESGGGERPGERSKDEREGKRKDAEKTETGGLKDGCRGRETV